MTILHSLIAQRGFGPQTQWRPLRKNLTVGWGLTICFWLGAPWFNYWFSFTLSHSRISYVLVFIYYGEEFDFKLFALMLRLMSWEPLCEANFYVFSVLRVTSGPRVKLADRKNALNPRCFSTDRSRAVVKVLVLLFDALWFILWGDLFYVLSCVILFLCFSVLLSLPLPRLGKRELVLIWCFSYVYSICACLVLSVSSPSWCLGRDAVCDCGTPWTFLFPFFLQESMYILNPLVLQFCFSYVCWCKFVVLRCDLFLLFHISSSSLGSSGKLCVLSVAFSW